jgi:hypothetical protein
MHFSLIYFSSVINILCFYPLEILVLAHQT